MGRINTLFALAATSSLVTLVAGAAMAGEAVPSLDLRGFDPPTAADGGLYYEPAASPATGDWNAAWWHNYTWRPVTLRDPETDDIVHEVVAHQLGGDLVLNVGFFERFTLGFDLPYVLYQTGDSPDARTDATLGEYVLPEQAMGDLKLVAKVTAVQPTNGEFGGFALAVHERLGLPTGDEASYLGEAAVQSETRLLVEYRYLAVSAHAAAGLRLRAEEDKFGCGSGAAPDCPTTFGHQIPWGLSLSFRPQVIGLDDTGTSTWFVESFGYVPVSPESPFSNAKVSQVQLGGGARIGLPADLSILAGIDVALIGGVGNAPVRGHLALSWAPRKHDMDDDGVRDEDDMCPELKEDLDGFQDDDGCPDWDNDEDGVPDEEDQCNGEVEDEDGFEDDDGCVDPDNDDDGILDDDDACPLVAGIASDDPKQRGCPDFDPDRDGVLAGADLCPAEPEDVDGFQDDDGCPDDDNDSDGFLDADDACRDQAGVGYPDRPEDDGCPDQDGDGFTDAKDDCPAEAGVASEEAGKQGCPEAEEKP